MVKSRCHELEKMAFDRQEHAQYWQNMYKEATSVDVSRDSDKMGGLGAEQIERYEASIKELKVHLNETMRKNHDLDAHTIELSENLRMEQETSNNVIASMEAQQMQIEQLEDKRDQMNQKIDTRDVLI